jgi:hypothetical protein
MKSLEFKKLIKEAVREVVREELSSIKKLLVEQYKSQKTTVPSKEHIVEKTIFSKRKPTPTPFPTPTMGGDPISNILAETANNMTKDEFNNMIGANSSMARDFNPAMVADQMGYSMPDIPQPVESVDEMIANAAKRGPVSDINQIKIDAVPDFSALMGTLKQKGKL